MAITVSSVQQYGISRDGGSTWLYFSKLPNSRDPQPMSPPIQRINKTKQVGVYWNLDLTWDVLTPAWWYRMENQMYSTSNQELLLNYLSDSLNSDGSPIWVYAPAVWADPPRARRRAMLFLDAVASFTGVEWYLPS
jgi:hypothetical protein